MKKLSQMFCNLLLMAVIDGLLIYTELGTAHPFQGDILHNITHFMNMDFIGFVGRQTK